MRGEEKRRRLELKTYVSGKRYGRSGRNSFSRAHMSPEER